MCEYATVGMCCHTVPVGFGCPLPTLFKTGSRQHCMNPSK